MLRIIWFLLFSSKILETKPAIWFTKKQKQTTGAIKTRRYLIISEKYQYQKQQMTKERRKKHHKKKKDRHPNRHDSVIAENLIFLSDFLTRK